MKMKLILSSKNYKMESLVTSQSVLSIKTSKIISPILSSHLNYLMEVGKLPDELKLGKITPIYKKESDELSENYRPVSTLLIFGKIFEKIIYSRLYKYFVSKGILHDRQFGFRKQHSTSHALNYSIAL